MPVHAGAREAAPRLPVRSGSRRCVATLATRALSVDVLQLPDAGCAYDSGFECQGRFLMHSMHRNLRFQLTGCLLMGWEPRKGEDG